MKTRMTREQLLEEFDIETGWIKNNPIDCLHRARHVLIKLINDFENRTCETCKYKYIVDSMTTECRNDNSPIDYLHLDCFPSFSCNEWEQE